jgi:integrase
MAKVLTEKAVEKLKPAAKRREIPDGGLSGLYLVIQPSGRKSWATRYRHNGKPCKLTIGSYPAVRLATAREKAGEALRAVSEGDDPAKSKRRQSTSPVDPNRDLVKSVVAEFLRKHFADKRSLWEVQRMFRHDVLPYWGDRRIQDISKRDVIELMDKLTDRGVGSMTNRVFSIGRKLCNWAVERDIISVSPFAGLKPPVAETSRDRVLSDDEVRWFWEACSHEPYPFGPLFRLLLLTGQRLSEVGEMTRDELKLSNRLWTIPRERVKNDTAHDVPLSAVAGDILAECPRIRSKAGYIFTTTGLTPVSGFGRAKLRIDKCIIELARKEARDDNASVPAWRLHDLRRTCASGMARLGVNLPVIEKVLNHTSGSFAGIVAVYQRHSFADERRSALEAWARFVTSLTAPATANVVPMSAAR